MHMRLYIYVNHFSFKETALGISIAIHILYTFPKAIVKSLIELSRKGRWNYLKIKSPQARIMYCVGPRIR